MLNREAAVGMIDAIAPCDGGHILYVLLAAQEAGGERTKLTDCLVKEGEPEPMSCSAACSPKHSSVWAEAMEAEFD